MTPAKLLIAQRLSESSEELKAIATLADEYRNYPRWALQTAEIRRASEFARWWSTEIRKEP